jgi:V8-like Glu-specific endopeptidase
MSLVLSKIQRRRGLAGIAGALILTAAGSGCREAESTSQAKNFFGPDDRIVVSSDNQSVEYPYNLIGKIFVAGGGRCTATLVGPKLILTAAHCVVDAAGKLKLPIDFEA